MQNTARLYAGDPNCVRIIVIKNTYLTGNGDILYAR